MQTNRHLADKEDFAYGLRRRDLDRLLEKYSKQDLKNLHEACVSTLPPATGNGLGVDPAGVLNTGFILAQLRADFLQLDLVNGFLPVSTYRQIEGYALGVTERQTLQRLIPNVRQRTKAFQEYLVTRRYDNHAGSPAQRNIVVRCLQALVALVQRIIDPQARVNHLFDQVAERSKAIGIPWETAVHRRRTHSLRRSEPCQETDEPIRI
jgi:hypothetical protein